MASIPQNVSESFRRRNKHLYGGQPIAPTVTAVTELAKVTKRLRQSSKPLLNKLETDFQAYIQCHTPNMKHLRAQSWRVKIAGSAWYKPDFCAWIDGKLTCYEVKGLKGKNIDRGKLALKVAASQYPEIDWYLCSKINGQWQMERVLP